MELEGEDWGRGEKGQKGLRGVEGFMEHSVGVNMEGTSLGAGFNPPRLP